MTKLVSNGDASLPVGMMSSLNPVTTNCLPQNGTCSGPHSIDAKNCELQPPANKLQCFGQTIYGIFRMLCIICHNIYHVLGYFIITWIILLPLYFLNRTFYYKLENHLYNWCLYTVGSWSWLAGMRVIECGDEIDSLLDKHVAQSQRNTANNNLNSSANRVPLRSPTLNSVNIGSADARSNSNGSAIEIPPSPTQEKSSPSGADTVHNTSSQRRGRIMLLSNHQSMADVPLMFQSFVTHSRYPLLWVMDYQFKFSHFGLVSATHGDYFIKAKFFKKSELTKHCSKFPDKELIILFPEGGFRYKRAAGSASYARKQGWPALNHLTWPRAGAFYDLADTTLGVTHVVDLTVLYASQTDVISLADVLFGTRPGPIYFHYRTYEVTPDTVLNEEWLNARWLEKEALMHDFYTNPSQFLNQRAGQLRPVVLSWTKMVNIHLFFMAVIYWSYVVGRVIYLMSTDK